MQRLTQTQRKAAGYGRSQKSTPRLSDILLLRTEGMQSLKQQAFPKGTYGNIKKIIRALPPFLLIIMVEVELVITVMESCTPQLTQQGRTVHPLSVSTAQGSRGAATEKAEKKTTYGAYTLVLKNSRR